MQWVQPLAQVFLPEGADVVGALARTTHLGIGAHADDLEFMAWHPILHCRDRADMAFTAVVVSDGRGSPREGRFAQLSDDDMRAVRQEEQREAARRGRYGALICLDHPSDEIRRPRNVALRDELRRIVEACGADEVYTHNPADRHDTHTALCLAVIDAVRAAATPPRRLLGCEVWRALDWLDEADKIKFDVSDGVSVMERLMEVFSSQIAGGKRYDLATVGRKRANATYLTSHAVDRAAALEYALDMTPLLADRALSVRAFMRQVVERFARDVDRRLERLS